MNNDHSFKILNPEGELTAFLVIHYSPAVAVAVFNISTRSMNDQSRVFTPEKMNKIMYFVELLLDIIITASVLHYSQVH